MSDRELLELAAKAAGYTLEDYFDAHDKYWPWCVELGDNWCPLTDDGDALRLAVKLRMRVSVGQVDWIASEYIGDFSDSEEIEADPYASTRRSIVRAAAEIGKAMREEA